MRQSFFLALLLVTLVCTPNTASAGEINVLGANGDTIMHNDLIPSARDGTFFGVTTLGDGQSLTQTFTIESQFSPFRPDLRLGKVTLEDQLDLNFSATDPPGGDFWRLPVTGLDPNADPYGTGVSNLMTYAFFGPSRDPSTVQPAELPQIVNDGANWIVEFTKPEGVSNVTYGAEWSRTLGNDWQDVVDSDPDVDRFRFVVPIDGRRKFTRYKAAEN